MNPYLLYVAYIESSYTPLKICVVSYPAHENLILLNEFYWLVKCCKTIMLFIFFACNLKQVCI